MTLWLSIFFAKFCQNGVVFERRCITCRFAASGDIAEQTSHDLATAGLWNSSGESDLIRCRDKLTAYGRAGVSSAFRPVAASPFFSHEAADASPPSDSNRRQRLRRLLREQPEHLSTSIVLRRCPETLSTSSTRPITQ